MILILLAVLTAVAAFAGRASLDPGRRVPLVVRVPVRRGR
jgi:hypothetical protein